MVAFSDRKQAVVRLPSDLFARMKERAEACGETEQTFLLSAVRQRVEECERSSAERRQSKQARKDSQASNGGLFSAGSSATKPPRPPADPGPVVIKVDSGRSGDVVSALAKKILAAPTYNRDRVKRDAFVAIRMCSDSETDAADSIRALEDQISRDAPTTGMLSTVLDLIKGT